MDDAAFEAIVIEAMRAPSAHNTQPVRWRLDGHRIQMCADLTRRLHVGDPHDRDLQIACGTAVEGTVLALAKRGFGAHVTWLDAKAQDNLWPFATVAPTGAPNAEDAALASCVGQRVTHRGGFLPIAPDALTGLAHAHATLVTAPADIGWLARSLDHAASALLRDKALRRELSQWMRLQPKEPAFLRDGLNRNSLFMDPVSARLAPWVLETRVYDVLSSIGLGPLLSGEQAKTRTASAIALFHWPVDGSMFAAGRAFYRLWLNATRLGVAGWPAAALADDAAARAAITDRFDLPEHHILLNALRLGRAKGATPQPTRLPLSELII